MNEFILEANNIVKQYATHRALDDVSLSIPKGSIFGLLGPNGAGKTTFIRIVTQIINRDGGEILFDGETLKPQHVERIGYLPEERGLYKKMKVGEQLIYLAQLKGLSKKQTMEKLKIWFEKFDMQTWWNKNVEDLSKGMQQKIQFVATVMHQPALIILDEPFSGFDPVNANLIKDEILELRNQGSTIIFSTHRMESVEELCDHVALINKSKKILDGRKEDIKAQFKPNLVSIEYEGDLGNIASNYEFAEAEQGRDGYHRAEIRLSETQDRKTLLKALVEQVNLHAFVEKLPTMNDIFISMVSDNNAQKNLETTEEKNN